MTTRLPSLCAPVAALPVVGSARYAAAHVLVGLLIGARQATCALCGMMYLQLRMADARLQAACGPPRRNGQAAATDRETAAVAT